MLLANSMVLLNDSFRLEILCFRLFATMQARRFRTIDLPKQAALFDDDGVSILEIGSSSMPNIMELCKRIDSKSSAVFAY